MDDWVTCSWVRANQVLARIQIWISHFLNYGFWCSHHNHNYWWATTAISQQPHEYGHSGRARSPDLVSHNLVLSKYHRQILWSAGGGSLTHTYTYFLREWIFPRGFRKEATNDLKTVDVSDRSQLAFVKWRSLVIYTLQLAIKRGQIKTTSTNC
jgi:hypothetical protein